MVSIDFMRLGKEAWKSHEPACASLKRMNLLLNEVKQTNPGLVRKFLFDMWELMYGPYFNEELAKEEVLHMVHKNRDGEEVWGEVVSMDEVMEILPEEHKKHCKWNAYVAINGFVHDVARTSLNKKEAIRAGYIYFFEDDDFDEGMNKTWWYFRNL